MSRPHRLDTALSRAHDEDPPNTHTHEPFTLTRKIRTLHACTLMQTRRDRRCAIALRAATQPLHSSACVLERPTLGDTDDGTPLSQEGYKQGSRG